MALLRPSLAASMMYPEKYIFAVLASMQKANYCLFILHTLFFSEKCSA
jgi:hypothetical protein